MGEASITDWISALSALTSTFIVGLGAYYAYKQINVWKVEHRHRRRAEIAEDVLVAAHSAMHALNGLRSPLYSVPREEKDNKTYIFHHRAKLLSERNSEFEKLRVASIRAKAVLAADDVNNAIIKIFDARTEFWDALEFLAEYAETPDDELSSDEKAMKKDAHFKVFGRFGEKDELHMTTTKTLEDLDRILGSIIRLSDTAAR